MNYFENVSNHPLHRHALQQRREGICCTILVVRMF
jgi:hypothetical protein